MHKDKEKRREYMREYMRKYREKKSDGEKETVEGFLQVDGGVVHFIKDN